MDTSNNASLELKRIAKTMHVKEQTGSSCLRSVYMYTNRWFRCCRTTKPSVEYASLFVHACIRIATNAATQTNENRRRRPMMPPHGDHPRVLIGWHQQWSHSYVRHWIATTVRAAMHEIACVNVVCYLP